MNAETIEAILEVLEKAAPIAVGVVAIVASLEKMLASEDLTDEQRAKMQAASDDLHSRFQATP